jgi:hypothetical protein
LNPWVCLLDAGVSSVISFPATGYAVTVETLILSFDTTGDKLTVEILASATPA